MTQRTIDGVKPRGGHATLRGDYLYFVTANVQNRRWFFVTAERAEKLGQAIQTCCRIKMFDLLAYCILPNHFHLLVRKLSQNEVVNRNNTQRRLGSLRCGTRYVSAHNARVHFEQPSLDSDDHFLFPHRRLPSRRSLSKRFTLSDLMHSIKSTYSQTLRLGKFWQHRSYVRIVGTEEYLNTLVDYIRGNYTKMKLPEDYGQVPFVYFDLEAFERLEP